jgi:hypothetical protein
MDELELVSQTTTTAQAYSFRFKWGWAIFTLNDHTGELSIHSDWGTYGHRWHTGSLGKGHTLHTFLAQCDGDYVARKLKLGTQSKCLDDVLCPDLSLRELQREICEARRSGDLDKARARDLFDLANDWTHGGTFSYEDCPAALADYLSHEQHESMRRKPSARFLFIRNQLWPFFAAWLSENVVRTPPAEMANG